MPPLNKFRVLALGLLIVAGLAVGMYWHRLLASADQLRSDVLAQHTLTAARLAAATSTQTEALVRNLDSSLIHLRVDFLAHPDKFDASLHAVASGLPALAVPQIGLIDADGNLAASSLGVAEKLYLGDREHFRIHAQGGYGDRLFVSAPVLGRRSGTWSIQLSRRIDEKGKFRGVIVASVSPEYLAVQLAKFELGENDTIALFRQDGIYLSRSPKLLDFMGKAARPDLPFLGPFAVDHGTFRSTGSHEPIKRIYAWRRLGDYPLVAAAGLAEADFFAPLEAEIRHNLVINGIGTSLVILLAGTIALLLIRLGRQQEKLEASEARFRTLFEILPEGILVIGAEGSIQAANDAALTILGSDRKHLDDRSYRLLYPDGQAVPLADYPSRRCLREGLSLSQSLYAIDTAGVRRWLSISSRPMPQRSAGVAISITDITRLIELEESLRVSQSVFLTTAEGILVTDADGTIISVNPAFTTITGYPAEAVVGQTPRILASGRHDKAFYQEMFSALFHTGHWEGEITNRRQDGSLYVEWLRINVVSDADGRINRYVALFSDITVKKRQQEELWHQANYDALTNLPNRILFHDRLQQALAQSIRHQCRVAVLFIDLDRFKAVNDSHGHPAGDELLQQTAARISHCIRDEDTIARVGGDEFLVLLPNVPGPEVAYGVAEKILGTLNQPFTLSNATVAISASIGIAIFPDQASSAEELLARADTAMYEAKTAGRDTIRSCPVQPDETGSHDRILSHSRQP